MFLLLHGKSARGVYGKVLCGEAAGPPDEWCMRFSLIAKQVPLLYS